MFVVPPTRNLLPSGKVYDLSRLRLHMLDKKEKNYEAIKKALSLLEASFGHAFHNRTKMSTST